ncbi:hypothetical protein FS837_008613 [Tulasnella sp. UAMH 9824]|nr:hypothetical protein FS837_008613 [Tulasnella sp. UAMH 9824]
MPQPQHLQQQAQNAQHQQQNGPFYPSLYLYPLNDSFVPKQISLAPQNGRVKIGRQTNAKTVPGERNGYFDSKVLSRQHAEIWEEGGKIFIKDVKSSNGTFINGERLSQEGVESEPFELKTGDTVEFGIDIVGEDNKTIIHHKVAANVVCILTPDDLANIPMHHSGPNNRRGLGSQLQANQAQNNALGGMGGAPRAGKSGLTFDHILSRLQTELAKSRETGSELQTLTGALVDVQDTLGGALPPNLPPYPASLPPVRPPPATAEQAAGAAGRATSPPVDPAQLTNLQTQLHDTQSTLQQHLDKIRHLETYVSEQESVKREITFIKDQMEERKREVEILLMQRRRDHDGGFSRRREMVDDDDDDARSVATVTPDDDSEDEEDRRRRREELGRPRTPEPTGHLADEDFEDERRRQAELAAASQPTTSSAPAQPAAPQPDLSEIYSQNALLATRLETLTAQLDSAMELSRTLQTQAQLAHSTIAVLEAKVGSLEAAVQEQKDKAASSSPIAEEQQPTPEPAPVAEPSVSKSIWDAWRDTMEVGWKTERETWQSERDRLASAVKEWERRTTELERKEDERTSKEERLAAERKQRRESGFDSTSSSEEPSDESDGEGASREGEDERVPSMVNGFTSSPTKKKKGSKSSRRRKGVQNGLANGITVLPSPMSSPTSSASFDRSSRSMHTRRSTSPSSAEPSISDPSHSLMNGKLPLSPPNTSPRSRAESLAAGPIEDISSQTEGEASPEAGSQGLGLVNGNAVQHQFKAVPNVNGDGSFIGSAEMFAQRNGVGANGPTMKQMLGDIVSRLLGFVVALAGMGLFLWTVADVASLLFFDSVFSRQLFAWLWIDPADHLTPASTSSSSSSSSASILPAPSSFLMASRVMPYLQPLPYTVAAATTVILAAAAAAMYQNQLRI